MRELNSLRTVVLPAYGPGKRAGSPAYNSNPPRSRPGGWAYPGTMVVGDGEMTKEENMVHFGYVCANSFVAIAGTAIQRVWVSGHNPAAACLFVMAALTATAGQAVCCGCSIS